MLMQCGHDTKWLAWRNPVDVQSGIYCVFCEMDRLRSESAKHELRSVLNRAAFENTLYTLRVQLGFVTPQTDDEKEVVARIIEKARQP